MLIAYFEGNSVEILLAEAQGFGVILIDSRRYRMLSFLHCSLVLFEKAVGMSAILNR